MCSSCKCTSQVNKGLNILPNFFWLMSCNHSILRQSSNYNYGKGFSSKRQWYYASIKKHCLNKLCKNAVCFLQTVPWSTVITTFLSVMLLKLYYHQNKKCCICREIRHNSGGCNTSSKS